MFMKNTFKNKSLAFLVNFFIKNEQNKFLYIFKINTDIFVKKTMKKPKYISKSIGILEHFMIKNIFSKKHLSYSHILKDLF